MAFSCVELKKEIGNMRSELKNIRQELKKQNASIEKQVCEVKAQFQVDSLKHIPKPALDSSFEGNDEIAYYMKPIGFVSSCFKMKNGTPRQSSLCTLSEATLTIDKKIFTNPEHSLLGLSSFSHVWVIFVFHKNKNVENFTKAKVHPPRLNGVSAGVFSTRSPHRPNPIGLTLTRLDKIEGSTLYLSGVDLLDGTPILDIKPYIPAYDLPALQQETDTKSFEDIEIYTNMFSCNNKKMTQSEDHRRSPVVLSKDEIEECQKNLNLILEKNCTTAEWLNLPPVTDLDVAFTTRAVKDVEQFHSVSTHEQCDFCLDTLLGPEQALCAISEILKNDPRSVYRRNKCSDRLYYFSLDKMHVTCWFDGTLAEVLKVQPCSRVIEKT